MNDVVLVHDYLMVLCPGIGLHHFKQAVKESVKVYLILGKLKLARLDLAHIKNIVQY